MERRTCKQQTYLAEIAKQSIKAVAWFLAAYGNMWEERDKLREELLSKKDPGLDYLGEYQPIQIAEDPKIGRFIVRKVCFGEEAKSVAR